MYYPSFNIGIEEEYQLIDPESRELLGYVTQSMAQEKIIVREKDPAFDFAQRFNNAVIEAGTPVCVDIRDAREQLLRLRHKILELGVTYGFKVAAAGTHPFSHWDEQAQPMPRYQGIEDYGQMIVRRLLAFGVSIHIGIEDRELAVDVMNTMRYLLPHILCLSTSSPFWGGHNTGLKSYRSVLRDALPRSGIPGQFNSYQEYRSFVDILVRTKSIPDVGRIYYDIVPHHRFPTLVVRLCDMMPDYRDTLAITALIQATVAWMVDLCQRNMSFRLYERTLIGENKWRAVRYGLEGRLIDFGIEEEVPVQNLLQELLTQVQPLVDRFGTHREIDHIQTILKRGSSADQQLAVWKRQCQNNRPPAGVSKEESKRVSKEALYAVVDHIVAQTEESE